MLTKRNHKSLFSFGSLWDLLRYPTHIWHRGNFSDPGPVVTLLSGSLPSNSFMFFFFNWIPDNRLLIGFSYLFVLINPPSQSSPSSVPHSSHSFWPFLPPAFPHTPHFTWRQLFTAGVMDAWVNLFVLYPVLTLLSECSKSNLIPLRCLASHVEMSSPKH